MLPFVTLIALCLFSNSAQAASSYSPALIQDAKKVIELYESQTEHSIAQDAFLQKINLLNSAFAEDSNYDCFYAGWPSHLKISGEKKFCENPKTALEYKNQNCLNNQTACNPVLFGADVCTEAGTPSQRNTSFSQCEKLFQNKYHGKYDLIQPSDDKQKALLEDTLKLAEEICEKGAIGTQHGTAMCSKFLTKIKAMPKAKDQAPPINSTEKKVTTEAPKKAVSITGPDCIATGALNALDHVSDLQKCATAIKTKQNGDQNTDQTADSAYAALKKNFESGPLCRMENSLSPLEQKVAALNIYAPGLKSYIASGDVGGLDLVYKNFQWNENFPDAKTEADRTQVAKSLFQKMSNEIQNEINASAKSTKPALQKSIDQALAHKGAQNCKFLDEAVFMKAYQGRMNVLKSSKSGDVKKTNLLTVIDTTKTFFDRRLFVLNLDNNKVLYNTQVALGHGPRNTNTYKKQLGVDPLKDPNYTGAQDPLSNVDGSQETPPGFLVTGGKPKSAYETPMTLTTLEKLKSGEAPLEKRTLIYHEQEVAPATDFFTSNEYKVDWRSKLDPATPINETLDALDENYGHDIHNLITYTDGCLGLPTDKVGAIKNKIENGSLIYIYSPNKNSNFTSE